MNKTKWKNPNIDIHSWFVRASFHELSRTYSCAPPRFWLPCPDPTPLAISQSKQTPTLAFKQFVMRTNYRSNFTLIYLKNMASTQWNCWSRCKIHKYTLRVRNLLCKLWWNVERWRRKRAVPMSSGSPRNIATDQSKNPKQNHNLPSLMTSVFFGFISFNNFNLVHFKDCNANN